MVWCVCVSGEEGGVLVSRAVRRIMVHSADQLYDW